MAKKATQPVVYTPLIKSTPPEFIEQKVENIPNYEDSGVKYQGKYKTQQTQNKYELRAQQTRFYVLGISTGAFGSTIFARSRPELKFFCTKMIISHAGRSTSSFAFGQIHLADVKGASASTRFYYYPTAATGEFNIELNFSDCPRLFEGDSFDLYTQYNFPAGEFLIIQLFGWEEQP
jgi:hypothetical protein